MIRSSQPKLTLWQRLTFSDVGPAVRRFAAAPAELSDLKQISFVAQAVAEKDDYPELRDALPRLRASVFRAVMHFERRSLWHMFVIHISDVHLSILAALLSVQVLRTFETDAAGQAGWSLARALGVGPSGPAAWMFAGGLGVVIFLVNIFATSLHGQKIEREMHVSYRVQSRLARYLHESILGMSRQARGRFHTGDLVNMAQADGRHIAEFYAHAGVDFPVLVVSVSVIVSIMFGLLGRAAVFGLAVLLLQVPLSLFFSWLGSRLHKELMERSDRRISLVTEWIQGMRLVRYFGWGSHFAGEIEHSAAREFRQEVKLKAKYSVSFALSTSWWMLVSLGVFAGFLYFGARKGASEVFAAIWLTAILGHQLNPLPWFVNILAEARVGAKRLETVFRARTQQEEFPAREALPPAVATRLEALAPRSDDGFVGIGFILEGVTVRFAPDEPPALDDVTATLPEGGLTAIVGAVGSGKSILLQLLLGDVVPSAGRVDIVVRGLRVPLHSAEGIAFLRRMQTYVPQEAFVASATLRENVPLRYLEDAHGGADDAKSTLDARVVNALHAASLGVDVSTFPQGLGTELGERGVNLSGGQKQRLSLARSVFADSPLVLLDDPLSAVDTETERALARELLAHRWRNGQTIVWCTHRLEHIGLAEHVIVLDAGRIVEQGGFASLSSRPDSRLSQLRKRLATEGA